MNRRLFIFLAALLCIFGAMLLLHALVQSPEAPDAAAAQQPVAHTLTAFFSMPPAPTSESVTSPAAWLRIAALFAFVFIIIPCIQCACDANGRVLNKRRYVRSFHLVFKQEVACG